jgi:diguanylate cyclase (GGDEF)-like protein/PAS domain S-box-containing protein
MSLDSGIANEGAPAEITDGAPCAPFDCRLILDHALNGVALCRMHFDGESPVDFTYLYTNPAFHQQTGLGPVVGRRVTEVIPAIRETDGALFEIYGRVARGGPPEKFELFITALQEWFSIGVFTPMPEHFVAIFDVVSERKRIEIALKESEQRFQMALAAANEGMWDWDLRNGLVYVSPRFFEMTGHTSDGVTPTVQFLKQLIHPDDADRVLKTMADHIVGRSKVRDLEYRMVTAAGEVKWVNGRGCVVERDARGRALRMMGTISDVTERRRAIDQLHKVSQAVEQSPESVVITDLAGTIQYVNETFVSTTGYTRAEVIGCNPRILQSGKTPRSTYDSMWSALSEGRIWKGEFHNKRKDSSEYIEIATVSPIRRTDGTVTHYLAVKQDVTGRKQTEERLRQATKVFESTVEGILITDADTRIMAVNPAFCRITGYDESEVIGQTPKMFQSGRHGASFYRTLWDSLKRTGLWRGEIWDRRKSGQIYPAWMTINAVKDEQGRISNYVSVFSDIADIKQYEERLEYLSHHDLLTQLPNRMLLVDRIDRAIEHARREGARIAVLFINLNSFKKVNDGFGHPVGDRLLQFVASRLTDALRREDTVARVGDDNFVVLLESVADVEYVSGVARKLLAVLAEPFFIDQQMLFIGANIGIGAFPNDGTNSVDLLKNADAAMHRSMEESRGTFRFYSADLTQTAREHIRLEAALREALAKEEFVLHFQPQVNVMTGRIEGGEALIRWNRPGTGLVEPGKFIPHAEKSGLIVPIGEWVLHSACRHRQAWLKQGLGFGTIAVNVSPRQFASNDIVAQVRQTLSATGLPAEHLELEITEGAIMELGENAVRTLSALKDIGVRLAIDDFGTGYSSLAYLRRFPIDLLKIDQSFLRDIAHDRGAREIAATIIAMAHNLGMQVLAEGVETVEQLEFVRQRGCDRFQGYLHSRPVPAREFAGLARRQL